MKHYALVLLAIFYAAFSFAQITSIDDEDWEDTDAWDSGSLPTNGDVIVIEAGHTITVTTNNTSCNGAPATHLYIKGTLTFTNGSKLNLGCGSSITVEAGGRIDGGSGGGSSKKISICGTEEWNSGDPDVVGPASFGTPLPITLELFKIEKNDDSSIKVKWVTSAEENNDYFEILRSSNGLTYDVLETIDGAGNSTESLQYEFIDSNPIDGNSYYILRQTDYDGKYEEFGPLAIDFESQVSGNCVLTIYPNPCPGNCRAKLTECPKGETEVKIMMADATGHVVNEIYEMRNFDGSFDIKLDKSSNLKPGVYVIMAQSGSERFSEKAIIR